MVEDFVQLFFSLYDLVFYNYILMEIKVLFTEEPKYLKYNQDLKLSFQIGPQFPVTIS